MEYVLFYVNSSTCFVCSHGSDERLWKRRAEETAMGSVAGMYASYMIVPAHAM